MQNDGFYSPGDQQNNGNIQQVFPPSSSYLPDNYPQNSYQQPQQQGIWNWYKRQEKCTKIGIAGGMICLVFLVYVYFLSTISGSDASSIAPAIIPTTTEIDTVVSTSTQASTPTQAQTSNSMSTPNPTITSASQPAQPSVPMVLPTQTTNFQPSQAQTHTQATVPQPMQSSALTQPSTTEPTASPTQSPTVVPVVSPTQSPVTAPTISPTQSPEPTQLPTPDPTTVPTGLSTPQPTQPPTRTGINGNPWSYNFDPGNLIYSPPANFCSFFPCINSFWLSTNGYIDECKDQTYSHSGGVVGACSRHGGEMRPLYSH